MQKKGLGKGLDALLPSGLARDSTKLVDPAVIAPNPFQPRRNFDSDRINELADSIRSSGLLQPLLVRQKGAGFELIAGERRLRAALKLGLPEVPVIVKDVADSESMQLALIENLQREDLNPIEEAHAFERLQTDFDLTQDDIAQRVGKSRPSVANSLRLLLLPDEVKKHVAEGTIPAGQARALLGLDNSEAMISAARAVISGRLSTRNTEELVRRQSRKNRIKSENRQDPNITFLLEELQRRLGTKVRLAQGAKGTRGKLEIDYYSAEDLERITRLIMN